MAIDPVGVTIGLVGLFAASLDVLDRISTAKAYGKDFQLFVTKVETERLRLQLWGQAVGLAPAGTTLASQHLEDPRIRNKVQELLMWAIQLFDESEAVKKRHAPTRALIAFLPRRNTTGITGVRGGGSTTMKMRWAISGKRRSEKLLQELGWFVDKLHELVPTSGTHRAMTPLVIQEELSLAMNEFSFPPSITNCGPCAIGGPRLDHHIQRRKKKNVHRIAAIVAADMERKIRIDERYYPIEHMCLITILQVLHWVLI
ncbi:prion-inhibition and propagation-domain-containing protein [Trichophaea hybrida]|nr:prion-inhibition and propagation-domain-containing protein [Trichophaea hybrida]